VVVVVSNVAAALSLHPEAMVEISAL